MHVASRPFLFAGALLVGLAQAPPGFSQVMLSPAFESSGDSKPEADVPAEEPETPGPVADKPDGGRFSLHPAAEPDPALRFRLWPAVTAQRSDDAVPFVTRALLLQYQAIHQDKGSAKNFVDKFERFASASIDELPRDEIREFLQRYGDAALSELARAENRMGLSYDLGLGELSVKQAVSTLLPEIQETRNLARLLQLRIRLSIAEGRWDDAVDDLRLGLRLSEFASRSTNLIIGRLVGLAISGVMLGTVEEAIQQPGCPNLYWALATVPRQRLFEMADAIEFELDLLGRFGGRDVEFPSEPIGAESSRRRLLDLVESVSDTAETMAAEQRSKGFPEDLLRLGVGLYTVTSAEPARELLAKTTSWGERAYELSMPEATLRASVLRIARLRDTQLKWMLLPQPQAAVHRQDSELVLEQTNSVRDPMFALVGLLWPAVQQGMSASERSERQLHFLVTLEALRMHGASHGELPETLDQLDPVPAWNDPVTMEPFAYQRHSDTTAVLSRAPRWPGDQETEIEITLNLQTQGN